LYHFCYLLSDELPGGNRSTINTKTGYDDDDDYVQVFKDLFGDMMYSEGFSLRPVLLHPQTRGVVRLRSSDPNEHPYIEPNYLAHPDDIKILVEGVNRYVMLI